MPITLRIAVACALLAWSCDKPPAFLASSGQNEAKQDTTRAAEKSATDSWRYRMSGNLDDKNLRCLGTARVAELKSDSGEVCVNWSISEQNCTGSSTVDWLHEDGKTGKVCQNANGWELKKRLPGRAFCEPKVKTQAEQAVSLSLSCTWECRSAKEPCSGQATYEFSPPAHP